ncbi:unnamed protein product [Rotaria magnacalcarata]|uniref:Suppressor of cytokine signaling 7 n=3 Tax=Rotaria magnacalcarata TaxID=392030 RepID=A0A815TUC6_9BILA|nr:unnamed protein product [Rotaria magnacalcarata]CAF1683510.1 unnamed protein product [Rotaria magnacalcarata]CAF1924297.1 unnamed protein product [Rotaria magnacalcarata]CAF2023817.1 unnamed protein product [Rotaria magnacalcarata]CAF2107697.1 unnamed protein product [Rotaria magnacalcarata]
MKENFIEQQIVTMNNRSEILTDNEDKSPMIAQLDSLQRLKEVGWYWGPLSWIDAERLLKDKQDYSFIVRDSNHRHYFLAVTFKSQGNIHHTRIEHSNNSFGFYRSTTKSQCTSSDVVEFIENIIQHSQSGQFMFFIRSNVPGQPMTPVRLLYPVSRHAYMTSLKHITRFVIHRQISRDRIDDLDLPLRLQTFLKEPQIYTENIPSLDC